MKKSVKNVFVTEYFGKLINLLQQEKVKKILLESEFFVLITIG